MWSILPLLSTALASAIPLSPRSLSADQQVSLNTLLSLEYLEAGFFNVACERFDASNFTSQGFPEDTYSQICSIAQAKTSAIQTVGTLIHDSGLTPVSPCFYRFPVGDASSFLLQSYSISSIALSACLGSLTTFNSSSSSPPPPPLTDLCTLLSSTSTYLRSAGGSCPSSSPSTQPLPASWAYNLARPYIASCPQSNQPQVPRLPPLTWTAPYPSVNLRPPIEPGQFLSFTWRPATFLVPVPAGTKLYLALVGRESEGTGLDAEATFLEVVESKRNDYGFVLGQARLPETATGVNGTVYGCLTTFSGGLTLRELAGFGTLAGPVVVLIS